MITQIVRRRRPSRYGATELGIPPKSASSHDSVRYPDFPPDAGSFNRDKFFRDAYTYSDRKYQTYNYLTSNNPEHYRRAIIQGLDLFKDKPAGMNDWINPPHDDSYKLRLIKQIRKRRIKGRRIKPQFKDIFPFYYSPYDILYSLTRALRGLVYIIRGEEISRSFFTYYYFYYYFFFTEYILVHASLYFPILKLLANYNFWMLFDSLYFSFYELLLGFYLPFIVIFIFSQYHLFRSFFNYSVPVIISVVTFFYGFSLLPVYMLAGITPVFYFFCSAFFIAGFFAFYIFEINPYFFGLPQSGYFRGGYYLAAPPKENFLFLPRFYYRFYNWPVTVCEPKKPFTRFPFTQNVKSVVLFKRQSAYLAYNYFKYKLTPFYVEKKSDLAFSATGLIFPKSRYLNAYNLKEHINTIRDYPMKQDYLPWAAGGSEEIQLFDVWEVDEIPQSIRDYINFSDAYSQVSFVEFIAKSKAQDNSLGLYISDEERHFYSSIPSKHLIKALYPSLWLVSWLVALRPDKIEDVKQGLRLVSIPLRTDFVELNQSSAHDLNGIIPRWFIVFIDKYFSIFENFLNIVTRYRGYVFKPSFNTLELASKLLELNSILINARSLSPVFYFKLIKFLYRSLVRFQIIFIDKNLLKLPTDQFFTYIAIFRQFEEICFNLELRQAHLKKQNPSYKILALTVKLIKYKLRF
jgi:hypothetical protein